MRSTGRGDLSADTVKGTMENRLIITGASEAFGASLLASLGSLTLNWPSHPRVLVYDLGMDVETLAILRDNNVEVRKVPPFVPHWRKHFTWKIWCWNDAPARDVLWLDAGVVILQPADDVFDAIEKVGYFITPTYYPLDVTATEASCVGCGVKPEFRNGRMTFSGGIVGFRKEGVIGGIVKQALEIASVEDYIKSTIPLGRHDQAILSLLLYKHISCPIMFDTSIYAGWKSPEQVHGQKIWQHRCALRKEDLEYFQQHISKAGPPYLPAIPSAPVEKKPALKDLYKKFRSLPGKILRGKSTQVQKEPAEQSFYDGVRD